MIAGGVRVGDKDGRQAGGGELEDRAPGAGHHEVGGGERHGEPVDVEVLAQVVPGAQGARRSSG